MRTLEERVLKDADRAALAEASAWIVRLHGPHRTAELEAGFRAWLAASPENARQFELVTETWDAAATPVPGVARMGHWQNMPSRPRWLLAAAIGVLTIGAGGWGVNSFWLNPSYGTGIGEQRVIRLSDGSRVTLNSNSRVVVSYGKSQRRVSIDRGEAFFEIAQDASRPFRVRAGDDQVEALGTSFVVRREARELTVTLVEGKIAVSSLTGSPAKSTQVLMNLSESVILKPGQRLRIAGKGVKPEIDAPRMDAVTAWRRGEVVLDKTVLADAVAEMNRYDQKRLVIDDPGIAGLKISGIYHTGDSGMFAAMVSRLYGLDVDDRGGQLHLSSRSSLGSAGE